MDEKKLAILYGYLKENGAEVGDQKQFSAAMQDEKNLRGVWRMMKDAGDDVKEEDMFVSEYKAAPVSNGLAGNIMDFGTSVLEKKAESDRVNEQNASLIQEEIKRQGGKTAKPLVNAYNTPNTEFQQTIEQYAPQPIDENDPLQVNMQKYEGLQKKRQETQRLLENAKQETTLGVNVNKVDLSKKINPDNLSEVGLTALKYAQEKELPNEIRDAVIKGDDRVVSDYLLLHDEGYRLNYADKQDLAQAESSYGRPVTPKDRMDLWQGRTEVYAKADKEKYGEEADWLSPYAMLQSGDNTKLSEKLERMKPLFKNQDGSLYYNEELAKKDVIAQSSKLSAFEKPEEKLMAYYQILANRQKTLENYINQKYEGYGHTSESYAGGGGEKKSPIVQILGELQMKQLLGGAIPFLGADLGADPQAREWYKNANQLNAIAKYIKEGGAQKDDTWGDTFKGVAQDLMAVERYAKGLNVDVISTARQDIGNIQRGAMSQLGITPTAEEADRLKVQANKGEGLFSADTYIGFAYQQAAIGTQLFLAKGMTPTSQVPKLLAPLTNVSKGSTLGRALFSNTLSSKVANKVYSGLVGALGTGIEYQMVGALSGEEQGTSIRDEMTFGSGVVGSLGKSAAKPFTNWLGKVAGNRISNAAKRVVQGGASEIAEETPQTIYQAWEQKGGWEGIQEGVEQIIGKDDEGTLRRVNKALGFFVSMALGGYLDGGTSEELYQVMEKMIPDVEAASGEKVDKALLKEIVLGMQEGVKDKPVGINITDNVANFQINGKEFNYTPENGAVATEEATPEEIESANELGGQIMEIHEASTPQTPIQNAQQNPSIPQPQEAPETQTNEIITPTDQNQGENEQVVQETPSVEAAEPVQEPADVEAAEVAPTAEELDVRRAEIATRQGEIEPQLRAAKIEAEDLKKQLKADYSDEIADKLDEKRLEIDVLEKESLDLADEDTNIASQRETTLTEKETLDKRKAEIKAKTEENAANIQQLQAQYESAVDEGNRDLMKSLSAEKAALVAENESLAKEIEVLQPKAEAKKESPTSAKNAQVDKYDSDVDFEYKGKTYRQKKDGDIVEVENGKEFKAEFVTGDANKMLPIIYRARQKAAAEKPTIQENRITETPQAEKEVSAENKVTFESAKEGDVVMFQGEEFEVISKKKSRGGNNIVEMKKAGKRTKEQIKKEAINIVRNRVRGQYKTEQTDAEIEKNHFGMVMKEVQDGTATENSNTSVITIDKEQWDNEVSSKKEPTEKPIAETPKKEVVEKVENLQNMTTSEESVTEKEVASNDKDIEETIKKLEDKDISEIKGFLIKPLEALESRLFDMVYKDPKKPSRWKIKGSNYSYSSKKEAESAVESEYKRDVYTNSQAINKIGLREVTKAYHEAKQNGTNPELVKAVEDLIAESKGEITPTPETKVEKPQAKNIPIIDKRGEIVGMHTVLISDKRTFIEDEDFKKEKANPIEFEETASQETQIPVAPAAPKEEDNKPNKGKTAKEIAKEKTIKEGAPLPIKIKPKKEAKTAIVKSGKELAEMLGNDEKAQATGKMWDRVAEMWAAKTGKTVAQWWDRIESITVDGEGKGRVEKLNDKFKVYLGTDRDVSTAPHELAHIFQNDLSNAEKATVVQWVNDKLGKKYKPSQWNWNDSATSIEISEAFAEGFIEYLKEKQKPNSKLKDTEIGRIFDKFADWLKGVVNTIFKSEMTLNDQMRQLYQNIFDADKQFAAEVTEKKAQINTEKVQKKVQEIQSEGKANMAEQKADFVAQLAEAKRVLFEIAGLTDEVVINYRETLAQGGKNTASELKYIETQLSNFIENSILNSMSEMGFDKFVATVREKANSKVSDFQIFENKKGNTAIQIKVKDDGLFSFPAADIYNIEKTVQKEFPTNNKVAPKMPNPKSSVANIPDRTERDKALYRGSLEANQRAYDNAKDNLDGAKKALETAKTKKDAPSIKANQKLVEIFADELTKEAAILKAAKAVNWEVEGNQTLKDLAQEMETSPYSIWAALKAYGLPISEDNARNAMFLESTNKGAESVAQIEGSLATDLERTKDELYDRFGYKNDRTKIKFPTTESDKRQQRELYEAINDYEKKLDYIKKNRNELSKIADNKPKAENKVEGDKKDTPNKDAYMEKGKTIDRKTKRIDKENISVGDFVLSTHSVSYDIYRLFFYLLFCALACFFHFYNIISTPTFLF